MIEELPCNCIVGPALVMYRPEGSALEAHFLDVVVVVVNRCLADRSHHDYVLGAHGHFVFYVMVNKWTLLVVRNS